MAPKPRTLTQKEIDQVEALAAYLSAEEIADYFGMDRKTFYKIRERQPEVQAAYDKGLANAIAAVGGKLLEMARSGHPASMFFYLKTKARWRETNHVDVSSSDGTMSPPTTIKIVSG